MHCLKSVHRTHDSQFTCAVCFKLAPDRIENGVEWCVKILNSLFYSSYTKCRKDGSNYHYLVNEANTDKIIVWGIQLQEYTEETRFTASIRNCF